MNLHTDKNTNNNNSSSSSQKGKKRKEKDCVWFRHRPINNSVSKFYCRLRRFYCRFVSLKRSPRLLTHPHRALSSHTHTHTLFSFVSFAIVSRWLFSSFDSGLFSIARCCCYCCCCWWVFFLRRGLSVIDTACTIRLRACCLCARPESAWALHFDEMQK